MKVTVFGNPILRDLAQTLSEHDIATERVISLIGTLQSMLATKDFGVGLAAPQIGENVSIAIIDIKPTKNRPNAPVYKQVIINPRYEGIGRRASMWEGCLSSGTGDNTLYGKALRYKKISAAWMDEYGKKHQAILDDLPAQVFQHETDHLYGVLFVDKVRDTKTYMLASEYRKRVIRKK